MITLPELLEASAALHRHLCPRQVLGVRMGMLAGEVLGLALPPTDKRLLVVAETDGCAVDGISVATNCWVGRRTLRLEDFGKVAATFIDRQTGRAVRIVPRPDCRERARAYAPEVVNKWEAQLLGYQRMPAEALLSIQAVQLKVPVAQWLSRPGVKAICDTCGEEIMNEREVVRDGQVLCRACAGESYYWLTAEFPAGAGRSVECRTALAAE
jgi:formylmethanofuran dehydrogenase subunit E